MVITAQDTKLKPGYKRTEVGVIPEDWEVRPLTGLAIIHHGYGFQSKYFKSFGKYRLTTPGHFYETGGFRDVGEKQKFYDGPLPEGYLLSEGDLIVAMTEQADGLLGSAAIVPVSDTYLHNQRLGRVKVLSPELSVRFLYRVFNSKNYRAKVRETAAGTKVKHTSPSKLLEIPVFLPSTKAEQEAISKILSDTDALIECLDKLIAKKRDIKRATMQQLLTGKTRLPGFSKGPKQAYKQTEVGMIPKDWEVKNLGKFADLTSSTRIFEHEYVSSGIPFYRGKEINQLINFEKIDDKYFILEGRYNQIKSEFGAPNRGDILITAVGTLGNVYVVPNENKFYFKDGNLIWLRNIRNADSYYIAAQIRKKRLEIINNAIGSSQKALTIVVLKDVLIPYPPLPEQQAIATVLSDMDAEIAALEQRRDKTRALKQGMMQELLTGKTRLI